MRSHWYASLVLSLAAAPAMAHEGQEDPQDLSSLSIEELAQLPVRSASKGEEPLSSAPTALYVITGDDLLRASPTSLPEALRLAPNLQVQRVSAGGYAISARGFNGVETANKSLLLIDGVSAYSTLHSGIFWELRTPLIEDIAQIEVVSGPGGTLYGPNAVNGVINVVSRDAGDTPGLLARGTAGGNERTAAARFGASLGENAAVRVSGTYYDREDFSSSGALPNNAIRGWQAGFRADVGGDANRLTLSGDVFDSETFLVPGDGNHGHTLLARWRGTVSEGASVQLQTYYDYFRRRQQLTQDLLETLDVEGQLNVTGGGHNIVAGLGVRTTRDEFINNLNAFNLSPTRLRLWIFNAFAQDRLTIAPGVSAIAGVKLERSSFSGLEVLPNLRIAWQPNDRTLFWAAVSRAVRTPSRIDRQLVAPNILAGAPDFLSEKLIAFEAGYRGQLSSDSTLSVSVFLNRYDDLRSLRYIGGSEPFQLANDVRGYSYGTEAWGTQQIAPWWRLHAGAMLLGKDFEVKPGATDFAALGALGDDPEYRFLVRSQMDLPRGFTLDLGMRAVDRLDRTGVPGYVEAEGRIGWRASEQIELFVAGTDLLHESHLESGDASDTYGVERSIRGGARLMF